MKRSAHLAQCLNAVRDERMAAALEPRHGPLTVVPA